MDHQLLGFLLVSAVLVGLVVGGALVLGAVCFVFEVRARIEGRQ